MPHGLVANVDPKLGEQVLDVAQAERKPGAHHGRKADDAR